MIDVDVWNGHGTGHGASQRWGHLPSFVKFARICIRTNMASSPLYCLVDGPELKRILHIAVL